MKSEPRDNRRWWLTFSAFVDRAMRKVPLAAKCVWFVLYRNSRHGEVQIGIAQIAEAAGLSQSGVRGGLRRLIDAQLIKVVSRGGRNAGCTRYRFLRIPADE